MRACAHGEGLITSPPLKISPLQTRRLAGRAWSGHGFWHFEVWLFGIGSALCLNSFAVWTWGTYIPPPFFSAAPDYDDGKLCGGEARIGGNNSALGVVVLTRCVPDQWLAVL